MPPMTAKIWLRRNGSMRPETMTALSPQIYEYPTVQIRSGSRMVQHTPAAPASRSRDSPDVERTSSKAQRFQIWVMSGNPPYTRTKKTQQEPTATETYEVTRSSRVGSVRSVYFIENSLPVRIGITLLIGATAFTEAGDDICTLIAIP